MFLITAITTRDEIYTICVRGPFTKSKDLALRISQENDAKIVVMNGPERYVAYFVNGNEETKDVLSDFGN